MPNHIKNRIEIIGTPEQVKSVFEAFSTFYPSTPNKSYDGDIVYESEDGSIGWYNESTNTFTQQGKGPVIGIPNGFSIDYDKEWTRFPDFNKIVPMPDGLNITSDSWSNLIDGFSSHEPLKKFIDKIKNGITDEDLKTGLATLNQSIINYITTGYATWYEWSCAKWGTKCNSYSCEHENDNVWLFDTAWSGVPDIIEAMSKQFPDVTINYDYADEDTGYNVGIYVFKDGLVSHTEIENGSKEAYELAFKLRPEYAEHYHLVDGNYEYKDNDD